jgi:hypothetical protein
VTSKTAPFAVRFVERVEVVFLHKLYPTCRHHRARQRAHSRFQQHLHPFLCVLLSRKCSASRAASSARAKRRLRSTDSPTRIFPPLSPAPIASASSATVRATHFYSSFSDSCSPIRWRG